MAETTFPKQIPQYDDGPGKPTLSLYCDRPEAVVEDARSDQMGTCHATTQEERVERGRSAQKNRF